MIRGRQTRRDRKSTRLNSSHMSISYAVFCLKKKKKLARLEILIKNEIEQQFQDILDQKVGDCVNSYLPEFSGITLWYHHFPFFFFNDTATTEIYTLSLHDALPI